MATPRESLPRYLQLMWGIDVGTRRGPKPKLTVGDIGAAAAAIADADGLAAVSMKAVADRLGVTSMSLYRYVESKDDVYELMVDEGYGLPPAGLFDDADEWRTRIAAWSMGVAGRLRAHPWLTELPMLRPPAGPKTLRWTDAGIAAFNGTAFPDGQRLSTLLLISGFLRNHVRMSAELGAFDPDRPSSADHYGVVLADVIDAENYPNLRRAVAAEYLDDDGEDFYDDELRYGLDLILDGIATRIAAHR
ncbi:MAG: TetR/AcrR family transcriptional regulator C-terminal domain-containing protein [Gordonia sp. (in: high G+C Gram-positive bacteria)]|uniref:TetR/AcrR family transcriptional regulator n=1 Tax=Gordonia sp. (in: high G+C Gram-positive bacteria) TaxID=84139 RepID=UPI0039E6A9D0